jgi:hypothetical protein
MIIGRLTILLVICSLCTMCIVSAENDTSEKIGSEYAWNGTWSDPDYTMYITQNESGIAGVYVPYNLEKRDPGRLEGNLSEDKRTFSGIWKETGSNTYTLSDDKMSFFILGYNDPQASMTDPAQYTYNATRVGEITDPENPWTGDWVTVMKKYHITQNGTRMSGSGEPFTNVTDEMGTFSGIVSEDSSSYNGTWIEQGRFTFTLADDGSTYNATIANSLEPSAKEETTTFSK